MISNDVEKQIQLWPTTQLIPYAHNTRKHSAEQIQQIASSISQFGFANPVLIDARGCIIAGHGRVLAAEELGLAEVPVLILDLNETQKRAYRIVDNQLALNASWNEEALQKELAALVLEDFDCNLLGFEDGELAQLLAAEDDGKALTDADYVTDPPKVPACMPGDIWILGDHRLLVGDAINEVDVAHLMGSEQANLIFTDPPYNCAYQGYTRKHLTIQNDDMSPEEFKDFLTASFRSCHAIVKPDASVYICHSSSWQREFQDALEAAGFAVRCQLIWAKSTFAWGFNRYKFQHEPIFYCHLAGKTDSWYGNRSQSTVWQVDKPSSNREHPTSKPVELIERALLNSSQRGDIVADLFAGSGSTLIACERRGRKARLLEIDPRYADAIIRRWQEYSGKIAVLEGSNQNFNAISQARLGKAGGEQ